MLCDGCWVQGDGPHQCRLRVVRPNVQMTCICAVYEACASWKRTLAINWPKRA